MRSSQASTICHSSLLNGLEVENMAACGPSTTESVVTPVLASMSLSTGLPLITPMEPVTVPGSATIASAAIEMKYPPDAATSLIDTTTRLPALRALPTSHPVRTDRHTDQ